MHDASAVGIADIVGQVHGCQTLVARIHVVERVLEQQATELFALGCGDYGALFLVDTKTLQAFFDQAFGQHQQAAWCVHQRIGQLGVRVERLVGGNGPRGCRPDDDEGGCRVGGQGAQAKGSDECLFVGGFKGHVQCVAFLVRVFDLELGQRRAAVKAPVHGLQATVDKATLNDPFEGADLAGLVGRVHGAVGALPIAEHT